MMKMMSLPMTKAAPALLLCLQCLLCHAADALRICATATPLTTGAADVASRAATALRISVSRLQLVEAHFTSTDVILKMEVKDSVNVTNLEVVSRIGVLTESLLAAVQLVSIVEEGDPTGLTEPQRLLLTGLASAAASAIVTIIVLAAYKSRVASMRDQESQLAQQRERQAQFPAVAETERIWERLHALESQTALLLTLNDANPHSEDNEKAISHQLHQADTLQKPAQGIKTLVPVMLDDAGHGGDNSAPLLGDEASAACQRLWRAKESSETYDDQTPLGRYVSLNTKGLLNVDELTSERTLDAFRGHWAAETSLPRLPPTIARMIRAEGSNIHGLGLFAKVFIDSGITLFPYLRATAGTNPRFYFTEARLVLRFGVDWRHNVRFFCRHPDSDHYCVAEDPNARGWGCLINSCRGTVLEANCEIVWNQGDDSMHSIPWVRTRTPIPPLAELLLDYNVPSDVANAT